MVGRAARPRGRGCADDCRHGVGRRVRVGTDRGPPSYEAARLWADLRSDATYNRIEGRVALAGGRLAGLSLREVLNVVYADATRGFTTTAEYDAFDQLIGEPSRHEPPANTPKEIPGKRKVVRRLPKPAPGGMREILQRLDQSGGPLTPVPPKEQSRAR
jgi:hypothetical protein